MRCQLMLRKVFRSSITSHGSRYVAHAYSSIGGFLQSDNKDQLPRSLSEEEWIGPGTERSGRTFVTDEELSFLEQERQRTAVKYPRPMSPPKRQPEELDENFDDEKAFSEQYLAAKGIDYSKKPDDKAVQNTTNSAEEMDPAMLAEMAKWNFISSQEDPTTKSLVDYNDMATTIRLKELKECESRADIHTGYYTISGRLRENEIRSLLSLHRNGDTSAVEDMINGHELNRKDLDIVCKYVKSPLFSRDSEDDVFTGM